MATQKIHSTTQDFTEILDIEDGLLYFKGGNACCVLEISSINFFLLTQEEQNGRMYAYMSLLNSLSFYIQILIISKKIDLSLYLKILDEKFEAEKNEKIARHLQIYKEFIRQLIRGEDLLDKKIYIVVPFSQLELGLVTGTQSVVKKSQKEMSKDRMKEAIAGKRNQILTQVQRLGLHARPLETDELIKLYYELFNEESVTLNFEENDVRNIIL